jgi:glycosyltransferase involved in cell wall biosynthesis
MKVFFDHQIFSMQKYGGASKYFSELLKNIPFEYWTSSLLFSENEYIKGMPEFSCVMSLLKQNLRGKYYLMDILNRPFSISKILLGSFDILHQTHFTPYYPSNFLRKRKLVMTMHDMNHTKFRHLYPKSRIYDANRIQEEQKALINKSDAVVAVSRSTKDDLINLWNIEADKIKVIYHGIEINESMIEDLSNFSISYPYVLFVGARNGFKNFSTFLRAFMQISDKYPDLNIVCTGMPFTKEELIDFDQLRIKKKVHHISASEQEMHYLYSKAEFFIYPSLSEGFGMPILEAMACDCPVVLSNSSCFPEIAGDAGIYFDPENADDIAYKMERTLNDTQLKLQISHLAKQRVTGFSWKKTASEHLDLYKHLIS